MRLAQPLAKWINACYENPYLKMQLLCGSIIRMRPFRQCWVVAQISRMLMWTGVLPRGLASQFTPSSTALARNNQISSTPVLSPNFSVGTPSLFSMATSRFDIVVSFGLRIWRPPFSFPDAPPASKMGSGL